MAIKGLKPKYELELLNKGYSRVIGIDEVGRGAWAGPVVFGAYTYNLGQTCFRGITDSKLLSKKIREKLYPKVCLNTILKEIDIQDINKLGLGMSLRKCLSELIESLNDGNTYFLIDGGYSYLTSRNVESVVDGDAKFYSVAAASITAKVHRDRIMAEYEQKFPGYGFSRNVGYGTREHYGAIKNLGTIDIHRLTFRPIAQLQIPFS